tara:strand:- start:60 stop:1715 length:1656 start_codon:yes stop_codon:yes gene_type:complete
MAQNIERIPDDNYWINKFQLIVKPEQSGKTFVMIQQMIKNLNENNNNNTINFIFCDNNLLLTNQTLHRIGSTNELFNEYQDLDGNTYLEFSSHSRTKYKTQESVFHAIIVKKVRHIICCANFKRIDDIYNLIEEINVNIAEQYYFKIWIDEVDKFISYIDNTFNDLMINQHNVNVVGLTATPKRLFDIYSEINVLPIENTTSENYHGWEDNDRIIKENNFNYLGFIEHILDICNDENKIQPNTRWFIPALNTKASHHNVKDLCVENYNMCVIIINGQGLKIYTPNDVYEHKKDAELNTMLINYINIYNLNRYSIVITGNICISRGITIMSEEFMIDYAILSQCNNKCEASQLAGRTKGNIKHYRNYKIPIVYTTSKFNDVAIKWERQSRNLAKLAFDKEQIGEETIINKNEMKTCGEDYEYKIKGHTWNDLFNSYASAKQFLNKVKRHMRTNVNLKGTKKNVIHSNENTEFYSITSKLLKAGETTNDLTKYNRLTIERCNDLKCVYDIEASRCISTTNKGSRYLILPVYKNEDSLAKDVKFQVRYLYYKKN